MMNYQDIGAYDAITRRAQAAAQAMYNQSLASNSGEELALRRAQFAWQQEMDKAGLTGYFQGQATVPYLSQSAQMFGTWGTPTQGQQTLAANQQAYQQAYQNALAYGQYYAPGTAPTQGQQTLEAQNQQFQQGFNTWQEQARQEQMRQQTAQSYLNLLSSLRGPADWAKYQQVLGATPGGLRDLVGAAMGAYVPGGGATTGVQPQAVSLQSLMGQVAPWQTGGQPQAAYQQQNLAAYGGAPQTPGQQPWAGGNESAAGFQRGGGFQQASNDAGPFAQGGFQPPAQPGTGTQLEASGGGANLFGTLPAPNQVAPQSWRNLAPSQQQMLLGGWESQGWDKNDVQALMNQSLPRYAANAPSAGTWRLAA